MPGLDPGIHAAMAPASLAAWIAGSSPAMTMKRNVTWAASRVPLDAGHEQAELGFSGLGARQLADQAAVEHHEDAVGERQDLVELDRDQQDRLAGGAHLQQAAVDELDGPDVDAARRLYDQQQSRVALDRAR